MKLYKEIVEVKLDPTIKEKLEGIAAERGIDTQELIRWIIGDFLKYNAPTIVRGPVVVPIPANPFDDIMKVAKLQLNMLIKSGVFKCQNCTMPLTMKSIKDNKCENCGATVLGEE